jgi:hypothetical protein
MNIVKKAGLEFLTIAGINIATAGSLFVTLPLVVAGVWVFLLGGLSGE